MTAEDPAELLRQAQERSAQLETYAADLNRTYRELRRHLHHMTVLHEVNVTRASTTTTVTITHVSGPRIGRLRFIGSGRGRPVPPDHAEIP